ncbi:acyltransferase [Sediminitomix flava]|uniref:Succinyltransferase-like protein n=1 Tax=Sediminitomix flava TaxID=379075 RepID=A0A315Z5U4_SEDFL|nr:acyltransferase [Sediminitomix flava]PWJ38516.1 succinyltransferase-like protein [Sediminitomix flava]
MSILSWVKQNPKIKSLAHRMIIPKGEARPRTWVKWFVNPFYHKRSKGSKVCSSVRADLFPFNSFSLGAYSTVEDFSTLNNGVGALKIGENSRVGLGNVLIAPVTIGDNVILAQNIVVSGLNHNYQQINIPIKDQGVSTEEIIIDDGAWIGANATITAGVRIGKNSIIGAGSVVTKSVPDYHIAVGNPAKLVKYYNFETKNWEKIQTKDVSKQAQDSYQQN